MKKQKESHTAPSCDVESAGEVCYNTNLAYKKADGELFYAPAHLLIFVR
jgi:hypothetical protein